MATRIGVDIGGTFTDLVVYDHHSGEVRVEKVLTTPSAPELGCLEALRAVATRPGLLEECEYFLHGTTVGLNALLERQGATVGLLCTEGFRDALELRRGARPESCDLNWVPPDPLVPRYLRIPIGERINAQGTVVRALERRHVASAVETFRRHGVTAVAVCFMNAYANPAHELEAADALREYGFTGDVSLSHRLSREYRDYERTSTTVVDAFIRRRMADYLHRIGEGIRELGFSGDCLITRSGGGSMSFDDARERSFETINSGPVAGAEGAAELARSLDLGDLVTADVGGTSFDTSLIVNGRPQLLYQGEIDGMPIQSPWVDVRSIGAGGGSLAYVDSGGLLHVGPQSAGAQPGPACYARGGAEPTVTDAAFFLGMLGMGRLASSVQLERDRALEALNGLARQMYSDAHQVAVGIVKLACCTCANAIREITVEQGIDPRGLKILAFGGAGPLLATQIARELDIGVVIVPPFAGNFSAWGLLGSDIVRSSSRTQLFRLASDSVEHIDTTVRAMFAELASCEGAHSPPQQGEQELALGMRFSGQEYSLTIPVPWKNDKITMSSAELRRAFVEDYKDTFGITLDNAVEVIVLRATIRKSLPRRISSFDSKGPRAPEELQMYSFAHECECTAKTVPRSSLEYDQQHAGPAVIYEPTATTYVDADFSYCLESNGCLILRRAG